MVKESIQPTSGRMIRLFGRRSLSKELAWLRNTILLILAISLIVIFITATILLRVFMRKPLDILQKGIDRVAQGDYDYGLSEKP